MSEDDVMDYQKVIDLVHAAKAIIFDPAKTHDIAEKGRADYVTGAERRPIRNSSISAMQ